MLEREDEKYFCEQIAAVGGETRKVKWANRRGAPDRLVLLPYGLLFFVELKTKKGRLSKLQEDEVKLLHALGHSVFVIAGREEIDGLIRLIKTRLKECDAVAGRIKHNA